MFTRVNKILIGKDIDRDASVLDGSKFEVVAANINDGEVLVLDKNKKVLVAGSTIADTDTIYICQGTGSTYSYTNPAGTAVTGVRKVIFSDPIEGAKVRSYVGRSYEAKAEQVTTFTITSGTTPAIGTQYVLRIVYKDINEHPGQFTQTYRFISTDTDIDTVGAGLAAAVNGHSGARVVAVYTAGADTLALTGKPIPERTSNLTDIDEFDMVRFDAVLNYVTSTNIWANWAGVTVATTEASRGVGNWEEVRDIEKFTTGYMGVTDRRSFPVQVPDFSTVKSDYYDLIVIEHDKTYTSADNQYVKQAPLTTIIALETASTGINAYGQAANILARLNPWMASCPGAFSAISI